MYGFQHFEGILLKNQADVAQKNDLEDFLVTFGVSGYALVVVLLFHNLRWYCDRLYAFLRQGDLSAIASSCPSDLVITSRQLGRSNLHGRGKVHGL